MFRKEIITILTVAATLAGGCGASKGSDSASGGEAGQKDTVQTYFSGDSALLYAKEQVAFGPRVPGTDPHLKASEWLQAELRRHGAEVSTQKTTIAAFNDTPLPVVNIFGRLNPKAPARVLLLAHWDCRPWADEDPDPANRLKPVDGANDGASGTAVLLELARVLAKQLPDSVGVDILLTDAEDYGSDEHEDSWALGARYFADNLPEPGYSPLSAILLDMVGDSAARFPREYFSEESDPALLDRLWGIASDLGYGSLFVNEPGNAITDDHLELIQAGIPAVDIIDLRPDGFCPQWHTLGDTVEKLSPATLGAVGKVLETYIRGLAPGE